MFSFPHADPDLDILFEKLAAQMGVEFEKRPLKLCMEPCHSCDIYRAWRSKEVRGGLKSSCGGGKPQRGGDLFYGAGADDSSRHHDLWRNTP